MRAVFIQNFEKKRFQNRRNRRKIRTNLPNSKELSNIIAAFPSSPPPNTSWDEETLMKNLFFCDHLNTMHFDSLVCSSGVNFSFPGLINEKTKVSPVPKNLFCEFFQGSALKPPKITPDFV